MPFPTPHLDKLKAVLENEKLPPKDADRVKKAITFYEQWIKDLERATGSPDELLNEYVALLNAYRMYR